MLFHSGFFDKRQIFMKEIPSKLNKNNSNKINCDPGDKQAQAIAYLELEKSKLEAYSTALESQKIELQYQIKTLESHITTQSQLIFQKTNELNELREQLNNIYRSTIWRWSRPYVKSRIWFRKKWQEFYHRKKPKLLISSPSVPTSLCVDIIIPVYKGVKETKHCIESVINSNQSTNKRIIVINDSSPEPELVSYLSGKAESGHIYLLTNQENFGFVESVNRGIILNPEHDILLLNSDTKVVGDWLDRIVRCAYSDDNIGTVTPFSNNATICSYPIFCAENDIPQKWTIESIDNLFRIFNDGDYIEIPTAIGFCMYIRRKCVQEVGLFDVQHFGKGYGEENDFCMRASALKWKHLLCGDTFVYHTGGVSFVERRDPRKEKAMCILRALYPEYEDIVHQHIIEDPAKSLRYKIDVARLIKSELPLFLFVTHGLGGGTEKHVEELGKLFFDQADILVLHSLEEGHYSLQWLKDSEALKLLFNLPENYHLLCDFLRRLEVNSIHFHHTTGMANCVLNLPKDLCIPYDYTVHDYYSICPQTNLVSVQNHYCREPLEDVCNRCLSITPSSKGEAIQSWRARYARFLNGARRVFVPSQDAVNRIRRYFPNANIIFAPHPELAIEKKGITQRNFSISEKEPLKIVVIGALSLVKGADILEECAVDARKRDLDLEFHLIGYAYRNLISAPESRLIWYGPYLDKQLLSLLDIINPHVAWFCAQWPETYSYTLSACLSAGLPIIAPDLGVFPERLSKRPWTWIRPWQTNAREWNNFFVKIRKENFLPQIGPSLSQEIPVDSAFDYTKDYIDTPKKKRIYSNDQTTKFIDDLMKKILVVNSSLT